MKIDAVIFDADGTILDTREFILQAFEHSLSTHGHSAVPRSHMHVVVSGSPIEECYAQLAPDGDVIALIDTHRTFQRERFDFITAYEGFADVVAELRQHGIKIGLCSSRGKNLRPSLEHMNLTHYFDAIVGGIDVAHHKPHPEPVLKTLALLECIPERAAMIGDTTADIGAAKAAGLALSIGITHGFGTRELFEAAGADHVIHSLPELLPIVLPAHT